MCHEFGHNLGAPDYYDTDYEENGSYSGTGQWDMMAGGSWNNSGATPAHHNPYTKWKYYNWITPTQLTSPQQVSMQNSAENQTDFYYYTTPTTGEYWLMENRQKTGFDSYVPGHGLLIFHVDESHINANDWGNDINVGSHQGLYPVCATATGNPPANYGTINSAGTPFPGTGAKTQFTDATTPASVSWAGANTNKPITAIVEQSSIISFDFMGGGNNPANFTAIASSTSQINLGWNAADFEGVLLAVSTNGTFGTPVDGTNYNAGNNIPGGGTVLYQGTASSFNHTGLQASTTYFYKIWAIEDGAPTYTSGVSTSESTLCDAINTLPFTQNFSTNSLPTCWENADNNGGGQVWQFNNPGDRTFNATTATNGFAILDSDNYGSGNSQNADLISVLFNFSAYTSVNLSFEHYFKSYSGSSAYFAYSIDGGSTWTTLETWATETENAATFSQDLSNQLAGQSNVKFKWNYTGTYGYYWAIDDISITGTEGSTNAVTFSVTDNATTNAVENASVTVNAQTITTNSSGLATINLADGTYPYSVSVIGFQSHSGSITVSGDAITEDVELAAYAPISFEIATFDGTCNGNDDGQIQILNVEGGTGIGYHYSIDDGATWQTNNTFTELVPNEYFIKVKDSENTTTNSESTTIQEPDPISFSTNPTNITTLGGNDGAIEFINVMGGNGNYEYSVNNGETWQTTALFSELVAGNYTTLVRDENNCVSNTQTITLTELVGISSIANQGLVYPNPTDGIIAIEWPGTSQVAVLNTLGQIVAQTTITNNGSIDLTTQKEGIYLVRIKTQNQIHTKRLIINR